jgi:hypothetical protein
MGIHRSAIRRQRRTDAAETKVENRFVKTKERARRDARMLEKIKGGDLPYTPAVMSWLSREIGKRSTLITTDDIKSLIA